MNIFDDSGKVSKKKTTSKKEIVKIEIEDVDFFD